MILVTVEVMQDFTRCFEMLHLPPYCISFLHNFSDSSIEFLNFSLNHILQKHINKVHKEKN